MVEEGDEDDGQRPHQPLPYATGYAPSGRSQCKVCRENIRTGSLRIARVGRSSHFEGWVDLWMHFECFWPKKRKMHITEAMMQGFVSLRPADQERCREMLKITAADYAEEQANPSKAIVKTVKAAYAKSKRGKCFICKDAIAKDAFKLAGNKSRWNHAKCFIERKLYEGDEDGIVGFEDLDDEDQELLRATFIRGRKRKASNQGAFNDESKPKKFKKEERVDFNLEKKPKPALKRELKVKSDRSGSIDADGESKPKKIKKEETVALIEPDSATEETPKPFLKKELKVNSATTMKREPIPRRNKKKGSRSVAIEISDDAEDVKPLFALGTSLNSGAGLSVTVEQAGPAKREPSEHEHIENFYRLLKSPNSDSFPGESKASWDRALQAVEAMLASIPATAIPVKTYKKRRN